MRGVIGTAGHVDHGKTALVRALTGIDTDRLKEEKARGITIELGFAHLALPSGRVVGVVDVPGHERFVRTMVSGAVGIDLVVLVVAADEGVMPQTREHLDICELLAIEHGVVALTKIDVVEPALRELAEADVREVLRGTFLDGAPLIACSAVSGEGLDELRVAIERRLEEPRATRAWPSTARDPDGLARLPIDRVFSMKGFGSVVTGTLWSGRLAVGDEVGLPGGAGGKVRNLQVHGESVSHVEPRSRVAVNVALAREVLERGATLGHAGTLEAGRVFDAALRLLPSTRRALRRRAKVLLHAGTTQVEAVVRLLEGDALAPGDTAFVEIEAHEPLALLPGDRFVLRGFELQKDHGTTLGGGVVVRVLGARSQRGRRTEPALLQRNLEAHANGDPVERTRLEVLRAGARGIERAALRRRLPYAPKSLDDALGRLVAKREILRIDPETYIAMEPVMELEARALEIVRRVRDVPRESLRAQVTDDPRLLDLVVASMVSAGSIRSDHDRLLSLDAVADELGTRLHALLMEAGLEPPRIVELPTLLRTPSIDATLATLVRAGRVVRLKELCFAAEVVDALRTRLVAHLEAHGRITPQEWKELSSVSRKFGIPLAEHFDAIRVTIRVGEERRLRR